MSKAHRVCGCCPVASGAPDDDNCDELMIGLAFEDIDTGDLGDLPEREMVETLMWPGDTARAKLGYGSSTPRAC